MWDPESPTFEARQSILDLASSLEGEAAKENLGDAMDTYFPVRVVFQVLRQDKPPAPDEVVEAIDRALARMDGAKEVADDHEGIVKTILAARKVFKENSVLDDDAEEDTEEEPDEGAGETTDE